MVTLHLGVIEAKYADSDEADTTADVATWLENKYHILGRFASVKKQEIADEMAKSVQSSLRRVMMGGPAGDPFARGSANIEHMMKEYISSKEVEIVLAGNTPPVPTQAALDGVRHRNKKASKGPRRPSFIDTGMYQGSLKSWVDEE